ncbi:hypothetical protein GDO81_012018 [Engystomops pustulosus]|uniref:Uncharacterized protein n=1 Tax=Engystomops pustulosus TaxID=76066 RepID=A0AAV7BIK6_ENGPU|nr:hypothetical protein GDO81_012018 [Engystomops pustulosus]
MIQKPCTLHLLFHRYSACHSCLVSCLLSLKNLQIHFYIFINCMYLQQKQPQTLIVEHLHLSGKSMLIYCSILFCLQTVIYSQEQ